MAVIVPVFVTWPLTVTDWPGWMASGATVGVSALNAMVDPVFWTVNRAALVSSW